MSRKTFLAYFVLLIGFVCAVAHHRLLLRSPYCAAGIFACLFLFPTVSYMTTEIALICLFFSTLVPMNAW